MGQHVLVVTWDNISLFLPFPGEEHVFASLEDYAKLLHAGQSCKCHPEGHPGEEEEVLLGIALL